MDNMKYDQLLANILEQEHELNPFLDAVMGFLWRRTDFFVTKKEGQKFGFAPGESEQLLISMFRKWRDQPSPRHLTKQLQKEGAKKMSDRLAAVPEVLCRTSSKSVCDTYNGADCGNYRWSQSIHEIEIVVPLPKHVTKLKDVSIEITSTSLTVKCIKDTDQSDWVTLVDGEFSHKMSKGDSIWSFSLEEHNITINCDKLEEKWWDALLTTEPKLDAGKLDNSRPFDELPEEDQMKVRELMWNKEQEKLGLKTTDQLKSEKILEKAWNVEGSPFKGTEFDPSVLKEF